MASREEAVDGGCVCWLCSRRACFIVGGVTVMSSVLYALYRYYRSGRDNELCKDEGFVDTTKVSLFVGASLKTGPARQGKTARIFLKILQLIDMNLSESVY